MNKKYKNPPILEAVCEFRFDPSSSWDPTIPGSLYQEIKEYFPKKNKIQQHDVVFNLDFKDGDGQEQRQITRRERAQFLRDDEKMFVQVDENILAINFLKPYSSWEDFFSQIKMVFVAYNLVAKPNSISRIGLRYINQIEVPSSVIDLEEYLNFRPFISKNMPQEIESCMAGTVFTFKNKRDRAKVMLTDGPGKIGHVNFILDVDYFLAEAGSVSLENVPQWIEEGHKEIENIFENAITDKTKSLFD